MLLCESFVFFCHFGTRCETKNPIFIACTAFFVIFCWFKLDLISILVSYKLLHCHFLSKVRSQVRFKVPYSQCLKIDLKYLIFSSRKYLNFSCARWNHHKSFELPAPLTFWVFDIFQVWNQNLIMKYEHSDQNFTFKWFNFIVVKNLSDFQTVCYSKSM